jgi:hypothetical protein
MMFKEVMRVLKKPSSTSPKRGTYIVITEGGPKEREHYFQAITAAGWAVKTEILCNTQTKPFSPASQYFIYVMQ